MKNLQRSLRLLILLGSFLFSRCTPEDIDYTGTTKEVITRGEWSVDYYFAGQDKTSQYSSYHFSFLGNGTLEGTAGTTSFSGTWSIVRDAERKELLNLDITTPHVIELNEVWIVNDANPALISLRNAANDQLRLRRQ